MILAVVAATAATERLPAAVVVRFFGKLFYSTSLASHALVFYTFEEQHGAELEAAGVGGLGRF